MSYRKCSFSSRISHCSNELESGRTRESRSKHLSNIESFLSKTESALKLQLAGIAFMEEEEMKAYLIQLELLSNLNPKQTNRQSNIKYKLKRILQESTQINMELSQEISTSSSFDVNLLTNANFLSNTSSSDSGISPDVIPATQKCTSSSEYESRSRDRRLRFKEHTRTSILGKRRKSTNFDTIILSETIQTKNEQQSQKILHNDDEPNSCSKNVIAEAEESLSDAETIIFDIENMDTIINNENTVVISNSQMFTEYCNNDKIGFLECTKSLEMLPKRHVDSLINNNSSNRSVKKSKKSKTINYWLSQSAHKNVNFGRRYDKSLTNVSSAALSSSQDIISATISTTIPPTVDKSFTIIPNSANCISKTIFASNNNNITDIGNSFSAENELEITSVNTEQNNEQTFDKRQEILRKLKQSEDMCKHFKLNFLAGLKKYSEAVEAKEHTKKEISRINNPFLSKLTKQKQNLCETTNAEDKDVNIERLTEMFADLVQKQLKLGELHKDELYKRFKDV